MHSYPLPSHPLSHDLSIVFRFILDKYENLMPLFLNSTYTNVKLYWEINTINITK